jgi:hypothetical protein
VHHGRHFGRTIHALCSVNALLTNGILREVELAERPEETFSAEYVMPVRNELSELKAVLEKEESIGSSSISFRWCQAWSNVSWTAPRRNSFLSPTWYVSFIPVFRRILITSVGRSRRARRAPGRTIPRASRAQSSTGSHRKGKLLTPL